MGRFSDFLDVIATTVVLWLATFMLAVLSYKFIAHGFLSVEGFPSGVLFLASSLYFGAVSIFTFIIVIFVTRDIWSEILEQKQN